MSDMIKSTVISYIFCCVLPFTLSAAILDGLDQNANSPRTLESKPDWNQAFDKSIGHLMLQAGEAFEAANFKESLQKVEEAKRRLPLNTQVKLARAHVLIRLNRNEEAFEELYTILNGDPKNPAYLRLVGYCYESMGKFQEALELYDRFSRVVRSNEKPEMYKGGVYFKMGRIDDAIDAYTRAVELNPDTPVTHEALGSAWLQSERYDEAITSFKKAIRLDANFARAYNSLGTALFRAERFEEGMDQVRRAIEVEEGYAQAHNNLGGMLALRGHPQRALEQLSRALDLNLFADATWQNTLSALDQIFPQVEGWKRPSAPALAEDPGHWHRQEAALYTEGEDIYKAVRHFIQAIQLDPNNPLNYNDLGSIIAATSGAGLARHFFRLALVLDPSYSLARENLDNLKDHYGKAMQEIKKRNLEKVVEQDPTNAGAYYQLGLILAEQGHFTNAIPCLLHTVELAPTNVLVRLGLSQVLHRAGKSNAGIEALLSALEIDITSRQAWAQLLQAVGFMIENPPNWNPPQPKGVSNRFEYAVWHYEHALKFDLNHSNDWAKAASHVYISILQYPEISGAFDLMGQICAKQITPRIAVPFFRFALKLQPGPKVQQHLDMALDEAIKERRSGNRKILLEKLKKNPDDSIAALNLGIHLAEQGQLASALAFFKRAYTALPDNRNVAYKYGRALFMTGAKEEALVVMNKILETEPENPVLLYRVAWLLLETQPGNKSALERAFLLNRLAIEQAKPNPPSEFLQNQARIYDLRGQREEARDAIQLAIRIAKKGGSNVAVEVLEQDASRYDSP
ncbi:MAG: tetratricopeptide (TPR) repeat protein [Verrucomicrobiales bacterium]|jgi:tetratricopeptide (TPR) repeat protein